MLRVVVLEVMVIQITIMSKFNSSKLIDVLGLITAIIGVVSSIIAEWSGKSDKLSKSDNNENQEKKNTEE